jgi:hypothetical protein
MIRFLSVEQERFLPLGGQEILDDFKSYYREVSVGCHRYSWFMKGPRRYFDSHGYCPFPTASI